MAGMLTLSLLGVFAIPAKASADYSLSSILSIFGINTGYYGYTSGGSSSYNSTSGQHQGDIEVIKQVKDLTTGSGFKESITVRSGSRVQISIEVKNKSNVDTNVVVTDEVEGNTVYVNNSLSLGGTPISGSLTSGGVTIFVPRKSDTSLYYELNVCSASGNAQHAYAYAPAIGAAVDAIKISTEQGLNNYSNFVSTCMSSFQQTSYSANTTLTYPTYSYPTYTNTGTTAPVVYSNPFGDWTGVNNSTSTTTTSNVSTSSNPFAGWTGVNNANSTTSTSSNPFGTWTGVNNSSSTTTATSSNPFGTWTGVNNATSAPTTTSTSNNPFGDWTGVSNSNVTTSAAATSSANPFGTWTGTNNATAPAQTSSTTGGNPFGDWTGVNSDVSSTNPFGEWHGVNSDYYSSDNPMGIWTGVNPTDPYSNEANNGNGLGDWTGVGPSEAKYDANGYTEDAWTGVSPKDSYAGVNSNVDTTASSAQPVRVAPTTGVNQTAPFVFAGLLTLAFLAYRNRKLLFN